MNRTILWGLTMLAGAGAKAGYEYLQKREQEKRLDPSEWNERDLALLVARKQAEIKAQQREAAAVHRAATSLGPGLDEENDASQVAGGPGFGGPRPV